MTAWLPRRRLALAVLLTGLLSSSWALLSPLASVPDEPAHVIYAAAVVRGQLGDGPLGRTVQVPADVALVGGLTCTAFHPDVTAECRQPFERRSGSAATLTGAGRYPPLYYAIVGLPTLAGFGPGQWYAMRLVSVLIGCLLLGVAALAWRRDPPIVVAGLALAVTPMTAFLLGSVNPNGAEIIAGVAVSLAGCGLLDTRWRQQVPSAGEVLALVVPAFYLALARPSSYVLLLALLAVLVVYAGPAVRRWPRGGPALLLGGAGAVAVGVLAARLTALPASAESGDVMAVTARMAASTAVHRFGGWLLETVGLFGWRDHEPPLSLRLLWLAGTGGLLIGALVVGSWLSRLSLVALAMGGVLVAPLFVLLTLFRDGIGYQGRYAMALTQSLPVLAAAVLARQPDRHPRWVRAIPVVAAVLGLLCLAGSWLRYAVGLPLPSSVGAVLSGVEWIPPTWPLVLLLATGAIAVAVRMGSPVSGSADVADRASMSS